MNTKEHKIDIDIIGYGTFTIVKGQSLKEIVLKNMPEKKHDFLCARIDNEIVHMDKVIDVDTEVEFLDIRDKDGLRVYRRTLSFTFIKACKDLFKDCKVSIEHSLNKGLYVEVHKDPELSKKDIVDIKKKMKEIISDDMEINRERMKSEEADIIFRKQNMDDKLRLSKYRRKDIINIYNCDGYYDKFYGFIAPYTGCIKEFDLQYYNSGVIIQFPTKESGFKIPEFERHDKLAKIFKEAETWGEILDVGYVGALNDKASNGEMADIIRISEALHEKKIAYIADKICEDPKRRIILIAGPSSSGKTTFAQRLSIQLRVNGKRPVSISLDDYFVNREDTPLDENGDYDFESIEAIDIKLFNENLLGLMNGKEVELPTFNFMTGKREYLGKKLKIDKDNPVIIEGIHGLNEKLTSYIDSKYKFKIYVSALTQLNIDSHNRIPTTDNRLIRRLVRDHKYRGSDAVKTLKQWDSVRRGEEMNIFPFQEEADAMFNSALVYELSILKRYAVPLLNEVKRDSEYFAESKRLLKFLSYFKDFDGESIIPNTSIIREFIGGSCFRN
ncbi:nucleoside kinase [Clostridiisalibacter paucivorans]|uniref:nucleoside kinase n=1 Tax=Clostridiisalibacter paucivorans TaxID=408753 RepID=UPI000688CD15|nr:nucleoside kinase [Clostridiisalibacter paucivorans]